MGTFLSMFSFCCCWDCFLQVGTETFSIEQVNILLRDTSVFDGSCGEGPCNAEVSAIGAVCTFLHVTFNILPLERIMTGLAYRTDLVRILWNFMKRCHENKRWPSLSEQTAYLSGDAPGWLLPLAVFCPVYKYVYFFRSWLLAFWTLWFL